MIYCFWVGLSWAATSTPSAAAQELVQIFLLCTNIYTSLIPSYFQETGYVRKGRETLIGEWDIKYLTHSDCHDYIETSYFLASLHLQDMSTQQTYCAQMQHPQTSHTASKGLPLKLDIGQPSPFMVLYKCGHPAPGSKSSLCRTV